MKIFQSKDIPDHIKQYFEPVPELGLEPTPDEYVAKMVEVFREVRRVLRDDGTCWINLGDSYAGNSKPGGGDPTIKMRNLGGKDYRQKHVPEGLKPKDLVGIPWLVAFALRADEWYLRSDIIWAKPNPMPESVRDRPTKAHEYIFLMSKAERYFYDNEAIKEESVMPAGTAGRWKGNRDLGLPGGQVRFGKPNLGGSADGYRNKRTVWTVATQPFPGSHFAVFPPKLIEPCILAGSKPGDLILDPFSGAGTTGLVALRHGRRYLGIELNPEYVAMSEKRIKDDAPLFNQLGS